jgi:hypothetical protein
VREWPGGRRRFGKKWRRLPSKSLKNVRSVVVIRRVVGQVQAPDGARVSVHVEGPYPVHGAGPGSHFTMNTLVRCCKSETWTPHTIVLVNHADEPVTVQARIDLLHDGRGLRHWRRPRLQHGRALHGTGCTLSAAIAAGLAHGRPLHDAVDAALAGLHAAIAQAPALGAGTRPLDHLAAAPRPAPRAGSTSGAR